MTSKYSNLFWHQGAKVFSEEVLNNAASRARIEHLENDVTKALMNLFEHGDKKLLKAFLQLLGVGEHPSSFAFDFQVRDTHAYRAQPRRIMLALVGASCGVAKGARYDTTHSIPDACIFNESTAILIEAKTQSPLIPEQLESHTRQFLGSATDTRKMTWEDLGEALGALQGLDATSRLLVAHFRDFLALIGLAEFKGFTASDFANLWSIATQSREEFIDNKALFHSKVRRLLAGLQQAATQDGGAKQIAQYTALTSYNVGTWSALYFHDGDPAIHVNQYPNLTFYYTAGALELTVNAEIQRSFELVMRRIEEDPAAYQSAIADLGDYSLALYWKFQYRPQDHFVWDLVPGYPHALTHSSFESLRKDILQIKDEWARYRATILHKMETGRYTQSQGRPYNAKEIEFARAKNPRPNFVYRIEKRIPVEEIEKLGKKIVPRLVNEVKRLRPLLAVFLKK